MSKCSEVLIIVLIIIVIVVSIKVIGVGPEPIPLTIRDVKVELAEPNETCSINVVSPTPYSEADPNYLEPLLSRIIELEKRVKTLEKHLKDLANISVIAMDIGRKWGYYEGEQE